MSGTTPINGLRYATLSDVPNAQTLSSNLATDLDTRLIPRFTNAAARNAAITSPTDGMYAYTTTDHFLWRYHGGLSKWIWNDPQTVYKSSSQSVTSSTVFTDSTGLSIAVEANCKYLFTNINFTLAATAGDNAIRHVFPASTLYNIGGIALDNAATSQNSGPIATGSSRGTASNGPQFGIGGAASSDTMCIIGGYISTTAAGTLKVQFCQFTSNASASWHLEGSSLQVTQIG